MSKSDSTLLVDLGNARLTVVAPDGSLGRTMPMTQGDPSSGGSFTAIMPRFTDGAGRIYFEPSLLVAPGGAITDSAPVSRFDQTSGRIDTVATVKSQERESQSSRQGGGMAMMIRPIPLSPRDDWAARVAYLLLRNNGNEATGVSVAECAGAGNRSYCRAQVCGSTPSRHRPAATRSPGRLQQPISRIARALHHLELHHEPLPAVSYPHRAKPVPHELQPGEALFQPLVHPAVQRRRCRARVSRERLGVEARANRVDP